MENNKYNYDEIYNTYDFNYFFSCMKEGSVPSNCNPVPVGYVAEWYNKYNCEYHDVYKDPIIELAKDLVKSGCDTLVYSGDVITHSMSAEDYADEIRYYIIKDPDDYDYDYDEGNGFNNYYDNEDDYEYDEDDDEDYDEEDYDEDDDEDDYDEEDDEELDDPYYDEDEDIEEYYENRLDDCLKW